MNRHQEACEAIWKYLQAESDFAIDHNFLHEYKYLFGPIEEILTLTESHIQDDLEDQFQSTQTEENEGPYAHV